MTRCRFKTALIAGLLMSPWTAAVAQGSACRPSLEPITQLVRMGLPIPVDACPGLFWGRKGNGSVGMMLLEGTPGLDLRYPTGIPGARLAYLHGVPSGVPSYPGYFYAFMPNGTVGMMPGR